MPGSEDSPAATGAREQAPRKGSAREPGEGSPGGNHVAGHCRERVRGVEGLSQTFKK